MNQLFKAWHKERKQMSWEFGLNPTKITFDDLTNEIACEKLDFDEHDWNMTILQSTGVPDKNGEQAFNGDLIMSNTYGYPMEVRWDEDAAYFYCHDHRGGEEDHLSMQEVRESEIIGSINSNPDMLSR
ncbi:YopX family protein [Brevibacillus porteri]|uniref:YopX family protein n=1 Tax=Brevibacillus porteri TaxID=2126350 RepID=UPI00363541CF